MDKGDVLVLCFIPLGVRKDTEVVLHFTHLGAQNCAEVVGVEEYLTVCKCRLGCVIVILNVYNSVVFKKSS